MYTQSRYTLFPMKPQKPNRRHWHAPRRGFALVITLSLMVLLTILAVGLLTMSTISLRAGSAGQARAEAQANARMALMLAIGELQTGMGPDQRVSARAKSIDAAAGDPNLLGAWESWHWKPGTSGPNYSEKSEKFKRWMASIRDKNTAHSVTGSSNAFEDPVWLVNRDTVGKPADKDSDPSLRADRVLMELSKNQRGAFAWAVTDESLKAPIQLREHELEKDAKPPTKAELIARRIAPPRARPEAILANLAPDQLGDPAKIVSLDSAVVAAKSLAEGKQVLSNQADVTPYSVGILSDVADGGLKTDLTTVFESTSASPNVNGKATVYNNANDGAPQWAYLRDHYQLHRRVGSSATTGNPKITLNSNSDLRPSSQGMTVSPAKERLMPVISKLQIMFSVVSHYSHLGDRINFFNTKGQPAGNERYAAPHLVYDPVVTLYNPYDVEITLSKLRVRIWDPPVLFGFKKNSDWLRPEFSSGEYHNLARFQIKYEKDKNARRWFTLLLTDAGRTTPYGGPITLKPGEVRLFSPFVEKQWTWGYETAGGYTVRRFFDWNADNKFGNKDGTTGNTFGVESVPGWDHRAGLQTDHLSYATRPDSTRYPFEIANNWNGGWLGIKLDDSFTVEAKPGRGVALANAPDFEVDLLAGLAADTDDNGTLGADYLRSYKFRFSDPASEISTTPKKPTIARTFLIGDLLQKPDEKFAGGKSPFALLTMAAKTTADTHDYSSPWLHNQPVVEGADMNTTRVGNALDSYDVRLEEVTDFTRSPGIEFDEKTNRAFYGPSLTANGGVSNVPMFRVPILPAASLGDLVPANLTSSAALPRVTHAFGNSRAHPLLPSGSISRSMTSGVPGASGLMLDHSYLLNDALWDSTFFSTVGGFSSNSMMPSLDRRALLKGFFEGDTQLLNSRLMPMPKGQGSAEEEAGTLEGLGDEKLSHRIASVMGVKGPFNVNSDSVGAWRALLSSLREQQLLGWNMANVAPDKDKTGFSRFGLPIAGDNTASNPNPVIDIAGQYMAWAGFRCLTDGEIDSLAKAIVTEIRARGSQDKAPSLTLGEFVNRHPGSAGSLHSLEGILQRAISQSGINDSALQSAKNSKKLGPVPTPNMITGIATPEARNGYNGKTGWSGDGSPPVLTQGDLLMALAPVITVRGDTFRIRSYGEARDPDGKVTARAWCEAIVQRTTDYLDSKDDPETKAADLKEDANKRFGRRFNITSFRWLSPEEV